MKRFTLDQLTFAMIFGGPAGGALAVAENYRAVGEYDSAARSVFAGVLLTGALCALPWWVGSLWTAPIGGVIGFSIMRLWLRYGDPRARPRTVELRHSTFALVGVMLAGWSSFLVTFLVTFLFFEL